MKKFFAFIMVVAMTVSALAASKSYYWNPDQFKPLSNQDTIIKAAPEEFGALTLPVVYKGSFKLEGSTVDVNKCKSVSGKVSADMYLVICQPCLDCYDCTLMPFSDQLNNDSQPLPLTKENLGPFDKDTSVPVSLTVATLYINIKYNVKKAEKVWYSFNLLENASDGSDPASEDNNFYFFTGSKSAPGFIQSNFGKTKDDDFAYSFIAFGKRTNYSSKYTPARMSADGTWTNKEATGSYKFTASVMKEYSGVASGNLNYIVEDTAADGIIYGLAAGSFSVKYNSLTDKVFKDIFVTDPEGCYGVGSCEAAIIETFEDKAKMEYVVEDGDTAFNLAVISYFIDAEYWD